MKCGLDEKDFREIPFNGLLGETNIISLNKQTSRYGIYKIFHNTFSNMKINQPSGKN